MSLQQLFLGMMVSVLLYMSETLFMSSLTNLHSIYKFERNSSWSFVTLSLHFDSYMWIEYLNFKGKFHVLQVVDGWWPWVPDTIFWSEELLEMPLGWYIWMMSTTFLTKFLSFLFIYQVILWGSSRAHCKTASRSLIHQ